ncbi:hypothetical protein [uncultured Methanolobus sp.]|uniref:hypothetical protein n=1 Tax=uncultured Methanolobus sp. TaxID=218300 RepID=UPI002AAB98A0|nr:hypothetical protein [uncultured Methanolobus sp.]
MKQVNQKFVDLQQKHIDGLVSQRDRFVNYRDESDDIVEYRVWQSEIDYITSELKDLGVIE